jgi:hypothetical protein
MSEAFLKINLENALRIIVQPYYSAPHTSSGAREYNWFSDHILNSSHMSSSKKLNLRGLRDGINRGFRISEDDFKKNQHYSDHWFTFFNTF